MNSINLNYYLIGHSHCCFCTMCFEDMGSEFDLPDQNLAPVAAAAVVVQVESLIVGREGLEEE